MHCAFSLTFLPDEMAMSSESPDISSGVPSVDQAMAVVAEGGQSGPASAPSPDRSREFSSPPLTYGPFMAIEGGRMAASPPDGGRMAAISAEGMVT